MACRLQLLELMGIKRYATAQSAPKPSSDLGFTTTVVGLAALAIAAGPARAGLESYVTGLSAPAAISQPDNSQELLRNLRAQNDEITRRLAPHTKKVMVAVVQKPAAVIGLRTPAPVAADRSPASVTAVDRGPASVGSSGGASGSQ